MFSTPIRCAGSASESFNSSPRETRESLFLWLNTFAKGEPEEIEELVISCSLSDATLSKACDLIRQWITKGHADGDLGSAWNQSFSSDLAPVDRPA